MGIILWIIFGAIAGYIASRIMGTNESWLWDIILGIVGALVGGFIMNLLGQSGVSGFNLYSLIVAIIGAVVVIYAGRFLRKTSSPS